MIWKFSLRLGFFVFLTAAGSFVAKAQDPAAAATSASQTLVRENGEWKADRILKRTQAG